MSLMTNIHYLTLWLISFLVGATITTTIWILLRKKMQDQSSRPSLSEADNRLFDQAIGILDRKVTEQSFSLHHVAQELKVAPGVVARIFKRRTGKPFVYSLMESRLEIAKERLRSSNCPEETVAESCGFKNTAELNRFFARVFRTTPAKYRLEQQVT